MGKIHFLQGICSSFTKTYSQLHFNYSVKGPSPSAFLRLDLLGMRTTRNITATPKHGRKSKTKTVLERG